MATLVDFQSLSADGSINQTTTKLIFQFDQDVSGLTANDIALVDTTNNVTFLSVTADGSPSLPYTPVSFVSAISDGGN